MSKTLVIVESPAKARTINAYLGDDFVVESSIGHIRDLPKRAADIPAAKKKEPWARLGVDVENGFKPLYVVDPDKRAHIAKLKKLLKEADRVLLATDEDREGESIAWHLLEVLKPKVPVGRMVFHEITPKAIAKAVESPRQIDQRLVDAQEARRILDRLYGYEVSPVLWKKVMPRLSAGRVQSVATRIIVERERARMAFTAATYWDIEAELTTKEGPSFDAKLIRLGDAPIATSKDFNSTGKLTRDGAVVLNEARASQLAQDLGSASIAVKSLVTKPYRRSPVAPFMTSTLQQEAGRKLRFSAARTMRAAQRLYENGFITYMRTDSTNLSDTALTAARNQINELYGADYLPDTPRSYKRKVKNAQEAHEAIRPAGDSFKTPQEVARGVEPDEAKIYELVWKRTLASQMVDARGQRVQLQARAETSSGEVATFSASGLTISFAGFLRAYVEGSDDPDAELDNRERRLPSMEEGQALSGEKFAPATHSTQAPARFTEASLVKRLEELGVGRPSTYASIIKTIVERGYVWKKKTALVPTFKAFAVVGLLEQHFADLVDYAFTARMEDELDQIAQGGAESVPWLQRFYFGAKKGGGAGLNGSGTSSTRGLRDMVVHELEQIDARQINTLPLGTDPEGRQIDVRVGRYGPYLQRGEDTTSVPEDLAPDELTVERAVELLNAPSGDRELGKHPESGLPVLLRQGRFGAYVQLGEAGEEHDKPKTQSLLRTMEANDVNLDDALRLLSLPRVIGQDSEGVDIAAHYGRYGAYVMRGNDRRSLESDDQVFTADVATALALLAEPPKRGRRTVVPLRELGDDPVSGKLITLRNGRFGHYVTDGETNASLRTGDTMDGITPERAQELLQLRRDRGPSVKKKRTKKKTTKKTTKKKTTKKKASKKKTTKKKTTKKKASKKKTTKKKASKKD